MKYQNIREEELKLKVARDFFPNFDTTEIIGNIDFSVFPAIDSLFGRTPLLWAEAKKGDFDVITMFVQLILTIGKARTFDKTLPPAFLGAFDFKKIAFVPYIAIQDIFYINDFNWNVTPSNHHSKEFLLLKERIEKALNEGKFLFDYEKDEKELRFFIKNNIAGAKTSAKIKIDKNNFIPIYLKWLEFVKPQIAVDWDDLKKVGILDCDFYLADLFVDDKNTQNIDDDVSIRESLFVIFQNQGYTISKENLKAMFDASISIKNKEAYQAFWKIYKRPPIKEYQEYIIERRELLVPQDIRERKGAFFTPRQWVELSQKYLADTFGENWQDEYYIWDCAAGTGNLLAGLTNKYNIFASTLDQADVAVMHERIDHGANLLKSHCFQFDFLNDPLDGSKLPPALLDILNDENKRKKLIIYINPPYAESGNSKQKAGTGSNKENVSKDTKVYHKYKPLIKRAISELYAQFIIRIHQEIPNCKIGQFSKLKIVQSLSFSDFRKVYRAKLEKFFTVPANTFDNVDGKFPIGFFIWDCEKKEQFKYKEGDVYNRNGNYIRTKGVFGVDDIKELANYWIKQYSKNSENGKIGILACSTPDYQHNGEVNISLTEGKGHISFIPINQDNLIPCSVYFASRLCYDANEQNDRDNFLNPEYENEKWLKYKDKFWKPNNSWLSDPEFQNDCLAYTLFHGQNRITANGSSQIADSQKPTANSQLPNHWLPFTESEVNAPERFQSHFMVEFIKGRLENSPLLKEGCPQDGVLDFKPNDNHTQVPPPSEGVRGRTFSPEATAVFDAGRELWKYYFKAISNLPMGNSQKPTAISHQPSLYDIREFFQGRNEKGRMNTKSDDEHYMFLIGELRDKLKTLAEKIQPKVYEYGFLRK